MNTDQLRSVIEAAWEQRSGLKPDTLSADLSAAIETSLATDPMGKTKGLGSVATQKPIVRRTLPGGQASFKPVALQADSLSRWNHFQLGHFPRLDLVLRVLVFSRESLWLGQ